MKNRVWVFFALSFLIGACNSSGGNADDLDTSNATSAGDTFLYSYELKSGEMGAIGGMVLYASPEVFRSEISMKFMGMVNETTFLTFSENPEETVILNAEGKTYSILKPSDMLEEYDMTQFQKQNIEIIGEEEMNGYKCTHIRIKTTMDIPGVGQIMGDGPVTVSDYWMSKDVPGIRLFEKMLASNPKMLNLDEGSQTIAKYGVLIKQVDTEDDVENMVTELVKAENTKISKEKFEIPGDYVQVVK